MGKSGAAAILQQVQEEGMGSRDLGGGYGVIRE